MKKTSDRHFIKVTHASDKSTPNIANLSQQIKNSQVDSIINNFANLVVRNNTATPDSKIDISFDSALLYDSTGKVAKATSGSITLDMAVSGLGGLDTTDTEASSTWYHIYAITNGTEVNGLISSSLTAPTLPAGYTYKSYMGSIYNDSGSDFIVISQRDDYVACEYELVLDKGSSLTEAIIDLTAFIPITAKALSGDLAEDVTTSLTSYGRIYTRIPGDSTVLNQSGFVTINNLRLSSFRILNTNPEGYPSIYYFVNETGFKLNVLINGWEY